MGKDGDEEEPEGQPGGVSVSQEKAAACLDPHPQSQTPIQLPTTLSTNAAILPSPMKSAGTARPIVEAMPRMPEMVNPLGPTLTNMPGREDSLGSLWVIKR